MKGQDNRDKTKQQLINELNDMRQQIAQFKESEEERKQLVEELRESEETMLGVANVTPDFIAIVDRGIIIHTINRSMAQRFGKSAEELVGTYGLDLLPPELARSRKQYLDKVFQTGQLCRWEDENRGMYFDNIVFPVRKE